MDACAYVRMDEMHALRRSSYLGDIHVLVRGELEV